MPGRSHGGAWRDGDPAGTQRVAKHAAPIAHQLRFGLALRQVHGDRPPLLGGESGAGAGAVGVSSRLVPFMPIPVVGKFPSPSGKEASYRWLTEKDLPQTIGRLSAWMGNAGILLRAYVYARMLGAEGMHRVADFATLNANYLMAELGKIGYTIAFPQRRASHEFVVSAKQLKDKTGVSAMDIAKRLLDKGFHPPTTYFPMLVPECLLIEPTETESKETLDAFVAAMKEIWSAHGRIVLERDFWIAVMKAQRDLGVAEGGFGSYVKPYKPYFIGREAYVAREQERKAASAKEVAERREQQRKIPQVTGIRHWNQENYTRIVIDLTGADGLRPGSVVSLQELLGDKRSRGAFGEVQLEALVRNVLPPASSAGSVEAKRSSRATSSRLAWSSPTPSFSTRPPGAVRVRASRSISIRSPSCKAAMGPLAAASGLTCPMHAPAVPPEKRPSVTRATLSPRPMPLMPRGSYAGMDCPFTDMEISG